MTKLEEKKNHLTSKIRRENARTKNILREKQEPNTKYERQKNCINKLYDEKDYSEGENTVMVREFLINVAIVIMKKVIAMVVDESIAGNKKER